MSKNSRSKAKNQTFHFKKRCDERLGVQIDRKALQRRIREHKFDENFYFLNKQSNRVSRYRFKFNNKWYIIPYDKNRHKVITIFEDKKQDPEKIEKISEIDEKKGFINFIKEIVNSFKNLFIKS